MEVAAIMLQQVTAQQNAALSLIKQNAQVEQALLEMIAQSSPSGGRGQTLDITV